MKQSEYTRTEGAEDRDTCIPRFYTDAEEYEVDGVKNWRDVEMVEVIMPGNSTTKPVHYVSEIDRKRWPKAYAAFREGKELAVVGTPLEQWPLMTRSMVMKLKSLGFRSVEDVSRMTEHAMGEVGLGARGLRLKAIAYVDEAQAQAITVKAIADAEKSERRSNELEAQNRELSELVRQLGERVRYMEQSNQFQTQNIASTPAQPAPQPVTPQAFSVFAQFDSAEARQEERREELASFDAEREKMAAKGISVVSQPPPGDVNLELPAKRRGRPTNAVLAARAAEG